jgi:2-amino-4-hydroxy-6-hydroxymethyldihydropteridine diphosphokinase
MTQPLGPASAGTAYLGLGSNVGDRLANLRAAVRLLDATEGVTVVGCSSVYETEPVGAILSQPDFYNAAVKVETDLEPGALLAACKRVEQELGRDADAPRHGPRLIDVDLLLFGGLTMVGKGLALPHPELTRRRFALVPLLELDPGLAHPDGTPLSEALGAIGAGQRVERVADLHS